MIPCSLWMLAFLAGEWGVWPGLLLVVGGGFALVLVVGGGFALVLVAVQCLVALVNLLSRPWLTREIPPDEPLVSVLIPARNEASTIGNLLSDLSRQPWPHLEILVFDDQSEDDTAAVVQVAAATDPRIRLISSPGLPEGWTGKNFGCHTLAATARGEFLLFLDADVRLGGHLTANAVAASRRLHTGLITIFPQQTMLTRGEKWTVPVMHYILVSLLPLPLVLRSSRPSLAAANGQFMFFTAEAYKKLQPHFRVRNTRVEDIAIARMMKQQGERVACLLGDERITCRMYYGFREAVNGFSRSVTAFFGNSFLLALLFWLLTTLGFVPLVLTPLLTPLLHPALEPAALFPFLPLPSNPGVSLLMLWLAFTLGTRIFVSLASRQPLFLNLGLLSIHQISLGLFIFKALRNKWKQGFEWKGRLVS